MKKFYEYDDFLRVTEGLLETYQDKLDLVKEAELQIRLLNIAFNVSDDYYKESNNKIEELKLKLKDNEVKNENNLKKMNDIKDLLNNEKKNVSEFKNEVEQYLSNIPSISSKDTIPSESKSNLQTTLLFKPLIS